MSSDSPVENVDQAAGINQDIELRLNYDKRIAYAFQQNGIPIVRDFVITNNSTHELREIRVNISCDPAFAEPYESRIDAIHSGEDYRLAPLDLALKGSYLSERHESIRGHIKVELQAGESLDRKSTRLNSSHT